MILLSMLKVGTSNTNALIMLQSVTWSAVSKVLGIVCPLVQVVPSAKVNVLPSSLKTAAGVA